MVVGEREGFYGGDKNQSQNGRWGKLDMGLGSSFCRVFGKGMRKELE